MLLLSCLLQRLVRQALLLVGILRAYGLRVDVASPTISDNFPICDVSNTVVHYALGLCDQVYPHLSETGLLGSNGEVQVNSNITHVVRAHTICCSTAIRSSDRFLRHLGTPKAWQRPSCFHSRPLSHGATTST